MFGYGLWVFLGLLFLYYRTINEKDKIPFSEMWWAFIFPLGAFVLATVNINIFITDFIFFKIIYYVLYLILITLWFYILTKQGINYFKK